MARSTWPTPYKDLPPEKKCRTNVDYSDDDRTRILTVVPDHGFLSFIVQNALYSTAQYIRDNNLTYEHRQQVIDFVCQRTNSRLAETTANGHVTGRTAELRGSTTNSANEQSDVRQTSQSGRKGQRPAGKRK